MLSVISWPSITPNSRPPGVSVAADTTWRDYRLGSLWGVFNSVSASLMAEKTERGERLLASMIQRHGRHALDLNALELLE